VRRPVVLDMPQFLTAVGLNFDVRDNPYEIPVPDPFGLPESVLNFRLPVIRPLCPTPGCNRGLTFFEDDVVNFFSPHAEGKSPSSNT
jgi:hypothetical protein